MATYFKELSDFDFFAFVNDTDTEITANGVTWSIPPAKVTEFHDMLVAYKPYFNAITNKKNRTSKQVQDHQEQRIVIEDYIEGFANQFLISNPAISNSEIELMGFNRRKGTKTTRPQIEAEVFAKMEAQASSKMLFICRTNSDSSRASLAKDANGVEVRYTIGTQPGSVNACKEKEISTKARFTLQLDADDAGKKIYAYLRWRNNSNPDKSGPWCDMLVTVIRS